MAAVTFVNNINVISGSLSFYDPALSAINAGSAALFKYSLGTSTTDLSASVVPTAEWTNNYSYVSNAQVVDISASAFVPADFQLPSGSWNGFLLSQPFPAGGGTVITVNPVTYVLRGFYSLTGQFEYWQSGAVNSTPPSGHSLLDVTVISVINVRNSA